MREDLQTKLEKLRQKIIFDNKSLEDLLIDVYRFLDSKENEDYNLCLAIICHICDIAPNDSMIQQLLHDCIIKSRIFLYDNLLQQRLRNFSPTISFQDNIATAAYTSNQTSTILTKPQMEVFKLFQEHKRLAISAPTSFGKTRIIREIIAHNNYQNIAIILPTVSLLSEQYQEIRSNLEGYIISKSSKVKIETNKKYILILTPERMNVFLEENSDFKINFFVMDEIYKTDYKLDDDRFRVFADILYKLAKTEADFYLIGPYINDFSSNFRRKFNVKFKLFNLEIVQKDFYIGIGSHRIGNTNIKVIADKFKSLLRILSSETIDGKFLIYRGTKQLVEDTAKKLIETWPVMSHNEEFVSYLSENISPNWDLIACLKRGVAFHHGAMPRHIQDLIVDEFNNGRVKYLFCTTSLTEGVNTSAKNVIVYDQKIGKNILKGLDKKNIEGRAGRFMKHFVGRVFHLDNIIEQTENNIVEIEYFDKENPSDETLIQIDSNDLIQTNLNKKELLKKRIQELDIPYELIKGNKFVNVNGQIQLIQLLRGENMLTLYAYSGNIPNNQTLEKILSIIFDNLFSDHDKGGDYKNDIGKKILMDLTRYYVYHTPTFGQLLSSVTVQKSRRKENARIRYTFNLISKYFEFVWPRYLKAFERIYNFVATQKGYAAINLDMVIAILEYGTKDTHEILLKDAGIPSEIIKKISDYFKDCKTFDDIQKKTKNISNELENKLDNIEYRIFKKYV